MATCRRLWFLKWSLALLPLRARILLTKQKEPQGTKVNEIKVREIVERCKLERYDLIETSNGWAARTPFDQPPDKLPNRKLSIGHEGGWKCFRSGQQGFITQLYAIMNNLSDGEARRDLIELGLLPRGYRPYNLTPLTKEGKINEATENEEWGKRKELERTLELSINQSKSYDWTGISEWRGIELSTVRSVFELSCISYLHEYPGVGSSIVFFSYSPPPQAELIGAMVRSTIPNAERKWSTIKKYPIWVPVWNKSATTIYLVEGQWDAIALWEAMGKYNRSTTSYQVMALCGGKNIKDYPEIMDYFKDKKIVQIPDEDKPDTMGKKQGENFLCSTYESLDSVASSHLLLRLPPGFKDFNEWWLKKPDEEDFKMWLDGEEKFSISEGVVIDSKFREDNEFSLDATVVLIDGVPTQIHKEKIADIEVASVSEIMKLIKPYPLLDEYVRGCMEVQESPPLWHVGSFLTYTAGVIGRRLKYSSGSAGILFPNFFSVITGYSGHGKSESMRMLRQCVSSTGSKLFGDANFSENAFYEDLEQNNQKIMVFDELDPWLNARDGTYRADAMKAIQNMYDAHNYSEACPLTGKFRTKKSFTINNPIVSILAGMVPHQTTTSENNLKGGLIGRLVFFYGTTKHRYIPEKGAINQHLRNRITIFFKSILDLPCIDGVYMKMSERAKEIFYKAYHLKQKQLEKIKHNNDFNTYTSRWDQRVLKFSMNFQVLSRSQVCSREAMIISEQSVISAIKLDQILDLGFMELFRDQMVGSVFSYDGKLQNRIMKFMNNHNGLEGVRRTDLCYFLQEKSSTIDQNINALVEAGRIVELKKKSKLGKGKMSVFYYLPQTEARKEHKPDEAMEQLLELSMEQKNGSGHDKGESRMAPIVVGPIESNNQVAGNYQQPEILTSMGDTEEGTAVVSEVENINLGES